MYGFMYCNNNNTDKKLSDKQADLQCLACEFNHSFSLHGSCELYLLCARFKTVIILQVGHCFYLGTKYSSVFNATFMDGAENVKWVNVPVSQLDIVFNQTENVSLGNIIIIVQFS